MHLQIQNGRPHNVWGYGYVTTALPHVSLCENVCQAMVVQYEFYLTGISSPFPNTYRLGQLATLKGVLSFLVLG